MDDCDGCDRWPRGGAKAPGMFAYVCWGDCSSSERLRPMDREYDFAIDGAGMVVFCAAVLCAIALRGCM